MIPFKLGDKSINVKNKWEEITLGEFLRFPTVPSDDPIKKVIYFYDIFSVLSGISKTELMNVNPEDMADDIIAECMAFMSTPMPNELPKEIAIAGKSIQIPEDISIKTHGQFLMFNTSCIQETRTEETTSRKFIWDKSALALAIYFQPLYTGKKFSGDDLKELESLCRDIPAIDAIPICSFFLRKYTNSSPLSPTYDTHPMMIILQQEQENSSSSEISM